MQRAHTHRLSAGRWGRGLTSTAAFLLVTAGTCLIAYPTMFNGFAPYDDEGYLLLAVRSFLDHGSLYDDVFTQYGPFYYEFWGAIFSLFAIPVTHDAGRLVTLIIWVAASLGLGGSVWRITGSVLLGVTSQMLVFVSLGTLDNEPMHPGGLTCLLLALIVAISTAINGRRVLPATGLLGVAVAGLLLVKVNVGAFALAALLLISSVTYPALAARFRLRRAIELGFVLTPVAVMSGELGQEWVRRYCLHATIAAAAVVLVLRCHSSAPQRRLRELAWFVAGLGAASLVICGVALATGTSPGGLVGGVVLGPIGQADAFSLPFRLTNSVLILDVAGCAAAAGLWAGFRSRRFRRHPASSRLVPLFSLVVGVGMGLSVLNFSASGTHIPIRATAGLAFAWVALLPVNGPGRERRCEFARLLLPPLAVLQGLHAYPVAGSQVGWSVFLLVPVAAICVDNGIRGLALALGNSKKRQQLVVIGTVAAVALTAFVAEMALRRPYVDTKAAFDHSVPLDLPGASMVRVRPAAAEVYRDVSEAIDRSCGTFLSLPGMNSFYLWSGKDPPTRLNTTHWMSLFNDEQQGLVVAAAKSPKVDCLLRSRSLIDFWMDGRRIPDGPLVRFIRRRFGQGPHFGTYELLRRKD